mgnify:CR=1 FL=1
MTKFVVAVRTFVYFALLGLTFGITFGFAYLATAVMLIPTSKDDFDKL